MFGYNMPKLNIRIDAKLMARICICVYVLSLIPMLILGLYDFPSADDFSMALQPHLYFKETGNFFGTVIESLKKSWIVYSGYEGYFFSIILTCICPSVFGEGFYVLTPFIILGMLTFGVCYFFDALFTRMWGMDRDLTTVVSVTSLFVMVNCLCDGNMRTEAIYWYSGAINYTFTFGMGFFWLGLIIRSVYEKEQKKRLRKLIWACIWGFFMGGANFMTGLELAICSALIIFILIMVRLGIFKALIEDEGMKKSFGLLFIPAIINIAGFMCACFSPGNAVRKSETNHYGAIKSVMLSIYSTLDVCINDYMRWEFIAFLILLIPVFWKLSKGLKYRLEHPVMFTLFSFLMVSSNMTPPLYGVASLDAGRLRALAFMEFWVMAALTVFYLTAWMRQHFFGLDKNAEDKTFSASSSAMILVTAAFIFLASILSIIPDSAYYSCTSAVTDLVSGTAATYKAENEARLVILNDDSITDAELVEHTVFPEMLYYWDITPDTSEWVNQATAKYYGKNSVVLIKP